MGYMRHHAIIVTGMDFPNRTTVTTAHEKALTLFGPGVSALSDEATNGYQSFCVWPDGSKEGWGESIAGDERRAEFKAWLRAHGSLDWIEVQFGDENYDNRALDASGLPPPEPLP